MKKKNTDQQPLGAHMSIQGGLYRAVLNGNSIGCTAVQLFTHSNRQWQMSKLTDEDIELFLESKKQTTITRVLAHGSYLLNLASPSTATRQQSRKTLKQELIRCNQLGIESLIIHPGASLGQKRDEAIRLIGDGVAEALDSTTGETFLLFETMAGQGTTLGSTLEELAMLLETTASPTKTGICIDTCHIFAAGYSISTENDYKNFISTVDNIIGLQNVHAFHLNDSAKELGSRVDRHADIGAGKIGLNAFRLIINDQQLKTVPKILETPAGSNKNHLENDKKNLEILQSLIEKQ